MHWESEGFFSPDLHIFTTYSKITEWQCNICCGKRSCIISRLRHMLGIQTSSSGTLRSAEAWAFFSNSNVVCREPAEVCRAEDKWVVANSSGNAVNRAAEVLSSSPDPHLTHWLMITTSAPKEALSFCPTAGLAGKDLQSPSAEKSALAAVQQPFLSWGRAWDVSHAWQEGVSLAVGKMLSKAQARENATLWAPTALHGDGESCVSNLGSSRWVS